MNYLYVQRMEIFDIYVVDFIIKISADKQFSRYSLEKMVKKYISSL